MTMRDEATPACVHEDAVKWNPFNGAVQCHRCGAVFALTGERVKIATQLDDDSDGMNSRKFARQWLEQRGMFDADADYGGWLAESVMAVVEKIASQGHTNSSMAILLACLTGIYADYDDSESPIWQAYWASPEGQALKASFIGESSATP
jgi:hypothetical protein